jgi:hypothetical protein
VGLKFDIFNLFNSEAKTGVSNQSWCQSSSGAACQAAVANFGTATSRGAFQAPRTFRVTLLVRY